MSLAVIPVFIIRLLRPVTLIRFGEIPSHRIGHFSEYVEVYLSERILGIQPVNAKDFFHHLGPIANSQFKKMSERQMKVVGLTRWLYRVNNSIPGGKAHNIIVSSRTPASPVHLYYKTLSSIEPQLLFTPEEEQIGIDGLARLGINEKSRFVCFVARDPTYLNKTFPNEDWQHHDFRNSNINNYLPAVNELTDRGYVAVRMGSIVQEPIYTSNPMVVDYACDGRTDFLDIYLSAKCRFFLSCGTGIDAVGTMFRKPIACVNFSVFGFPHAWGPNDLFIPKTLRLKKEDRDLTFKEVLSSGAGGFFRTEQFEQLGVEIKENNVEEIIDLAVEMDRRLTGEWESSPGDNELQERFWSLFAFNKSDHQFLPHIGSQFLRQHRDLLD